MDGIFGVGLGEMVIIALALMIIGGPRNTVKWAHELGGWIRKARMYWAKLSTELEKGLDAEGKELLDASKQLKQGFHEMRNATNPNAIMRQVTETVTSKTTKAENKPAPPAINTDKYAAWQTEEPKS